MRLNLGCGEDIRPGWFNIDLRSDVGADIVQDVTKLPFDDGEVDEILALDLLEHFPAFRVPDVLEEWRRVLRPGGVLTLKVPNLHALAEALIARATPDGIIRNIYGGKRWGPDGLWDTHFHGWTPTTLARDLHQNGFQILGNDLALNMTVKCRKSVAVAESGSRSTSSTETSV